MKQILVKLFQANFSLLALFAAGVSHAGGVEIIVNGGFDEGLGSWLRFSSASHDPDIDALNIPDSGSALITNQRSPTGSVGQRPFINGDDPLILTFEYKVLENTAHLGDPVEVFLQFLGPVCQSSTDYVLRNDEFIFQARGGGWKKSALTLITPPEQAACVNIKFGIENKIVSGYHLDNVSLQPANQAVAGEVIFSSGME